MTARWAARRAARRAATWRRAQAWVAARPLVADGLLALGLFLAEYLLYSLRQQLYGIHARSFPVLWLALGASCVTLRRWRPWLAVAALSGVIVATQIVGEPNEGLAVIVLTYTVAAYRPARPAALATLVLWLPGLSVAYALDRYRETVPELTAPIFLSMNALVALASFLAGRIVFHRRRSVTALEERARTAEVNQASLAAQAVAEERRRIARELHDMVAHHVSVMGVLATGSRRMLRRDPDAADEALATIEETGRTALREMRRLLGVLRTEPEPVGELEPQPGLAALTGLVDQVRDAGLPVSLRVSGDERPLEPGMALTVYRVVQEALTNALKHAGAGAAAEVRLDVGRLWLTVEVFDTGRGPKPNGSAVGHGLLGMRERIALFGGSLRTGPRPGGGFRVYARIPLEEGNA